MHSTGHQDLINSQVSSMALEHRDDLLDTAAVLDALALCHGHGSYLPRPSHGSAMARIEAPPSYPLDHFPVYGPGIEGRLRAVTATPLPVSPCGQRQDGCGGVL
ncbi:hypothetical protein ACIQU6_28425 [Streptomyces sp. NPDC090442]|uniref:hypothetical protein n=1 Tax=Streptomyces sp. NPDC090442 TaxID=3365962 RepID=UPI003804B3FA